MSNDSWQYLGPFEEGPIPDEWVWERLRLRRDRLLAATDFRMIPDAPWDTTAWAAYRQELRDLPETVTDPRTAEWPEPPNE